MKLKDWIYLRRFLVNNTFRYIIYIKYNNHFSLQALGEAQSDFKVQYD